MKLSVKEYGILSFVSLMNEHNSAHFIQIKGIWWTSFGWRIWRDVYVSRCRCFK